MSTTKPTTLRGNAAPFVPRGHVAHYEEPREAYMPEPYDPTTGMYELPPYSDGLYPPFYHTFEHEGLSFSSADVPIHAPTPAPAPTMRAAAPPFVSRRQVRCAYFAQGKCYRGDACDYSHSVDTPEMIEKHRRTTARRALCRNFAKGFCQLGCECPFAHSANEAAPDDVCGICLEEPTTFALMDGCDHMFCHDCIQTWRRDDEAPKEDRRKCPTCRQESLVVLKSARFLKGEARTLAIESQLATNATTPCKFHVTTGKCRLGHRCQFQHRDALGNDTKPREKAEFELRQRRREERESTFLADTFGTLVGIAQRLEMWDWSSDEEEWYEEYGYY